MQSNKHLFLFICLFLLGSSLFYRQEDIIKPLPIKSIRDSITAPTLPPTFAQDTVKTDSIKADSLNKKQGMLLDNILTAFSNTSKMNSNLKVSFHLNLSHFLQTSIGLLTFFPHHLGVYKRVFCYSLKMEGIRSNLLRSYNSVINCIFLCTFLTNFISHFKALLVY